MFKRMAFGLSSAPNCFPRIMSLILAGIPGVSIYLDDVVVHASSTALHDTRLEQVFRCFGQHGVTLNSVHAWDLGLRRLSSWASGS